VQGLLETKFEGTPAGISTMSPYAPTEPTPDDNYPKSWDEWDAERDEYLRQAIGEDLDDELERCVASPSASPSVSSSLSPSASP
jgi:hypothetical protein